MRKLFKTKFGLLTTGLVTLVLMSLTLVTAWRFYQVGKSPMAPTAPLSIPGAQEQCPCKSDDPSFDNFCNYPPSTPGCPMTFPGGYCDPNGDGDFSDADWNQGWYDYYNQCFGITPTPAADTCVLEFTIPSPIPTPKPTSTPTPRPTPTPTPPTLCLDLTSTAEGSILEEGQIVTFTCTGSGGPIDHVGFRVQINGAWQSLGTADAIPMPNDTYQGSITYTVLSTGIYRFECRVCTTSYCTVWGQAQ